MNVICFSFFSKEDHILLRGVLNGLKGTCYVDKNNKYADAGRLYWLCITMGVLDFPHTMIII